MHATFYALQDACQKKAVDSLQINRFFVAISHFDSVDFF